MKKRRHNSGPILIDGDSWYYEERGGIKVVHEARTPAGQFIQTDQFLIPWKKLTKSLRHRPKAKRISKD
jgi:hypothetical protein